MQVRYEEIDGPLEKGDWVLCPMDEIGIIESIGKELPWNNRHRVKIKYAHISNEGDIEEYAPSQLIRINVREMPLPLIELKKGYHVERVKANPLIRSVHIVDEERIKEIEEAMDFYAFEQKPIPQEWIDEVRELYLKQDKRIVEDKGQFATMILKRYAREATTNPRCTTDLSPLEEWLLMRLYQKQFTEKIS